MVKNVLEYLELDFEKSPDRVAYEDINHFFTYRNTYVFSRRIGTGIINLLGVSGKKPIAVYMDKNIESIVSFFGIVYSGNFYCPLDSKMPMERVNVILGVLKPEGIITDKKHVETVKKEFVSDARILLWEDLIDGEINQDLLKDVRSTSTEQDPLYVLFTSGSTGIPKGVLLSHRVVLNYLEWLKSEFEIDSDSVFGNQAPLYFDVSVHDIYGALYFDAKMVIIPKSYFTFPVKLVEYMNEKKVSTILWVPSAMCIVANLKTFRAALPKYLKQVMFAGEVLPRKQLDYWKEYLPEVVYANLYGPTETFVCTGYICNGQEPEGEPMPIGRPIYNSQAFLLDAEGELVADGEVGELCLRGDCLALGYYGNEERTQQAFVQNPLQRNYPEIIYHTGDLVRYDENGDLVYISRKDFQIKHMGYRIELGEIETAVYQVGGVRDCACVYNTEKKRIILCYDGNEWDKKELIKKLAEHLPEYMMPNQIKYLETLPHNANGKIDRKALMED